MTPNSARSFPAHVESEAKLDEVLSQPSAALIEFVRALRGPLVLLGVGGKMGPTLAVRARRAAEAAGHDLRIVAASRFTDAAARPWLEARGVETIACDLFAEDAAASLPDAENVIYLVGLKFGTSQNPALTWAANTLIPSTVARRYPRARIVALSTGNVYPLVPVASGGAVESHPLHPLGEYPNAAVARERIFEFFAQRHGTRLALLRLNYAVELRYGVLHDIAAKVWRGTAIDLRTGWFNCLWQGDANDLILRALDLATNPPAAWNLTGPVALGVRETARRFGELMQREPQFTGAESDTALLANSSRLHAALGAPEMPLDLVMRWTADWVMRGGRSLNKPTHFEVRDGQY